MNTNHTGLTCFNKSDKDKDVFFTNPVTQNIKTTKRESYRIQERKKYLIKAPHKESNKDEANAPPQADRRPANGISAQTPARTFGQSAGRTGRVPG